MRTQRLCALLLAMVVCSSVLFCWQAEAARPLQLLQQPQDQLAGNDYLILYPAAYDRARSVVVSWLGRLASGPSPRGPGH
uniref:Exostosin GT47 domain-containing protein n=1 Tax=Nymphaea colorata TaxID=210225 RepID=A0A5K1BN84_9MAGN